MSNMFDTFHDSTDTFFLLFALVYIEQSSCNNHDRLISLDTKYVKVNDYNNPTRLHEVSTFMYYPIFILLFQFNSDLQN